MPIYRFLIFSILFTSSYAIVEQKYNETKALQQVLDFVLPTFKIPDLLNPDKKDESPSIKIPNILPTALPTINIIPKAVPTIKIPEIIPKTLPTLPPFKLPTVKLPTVSSFPTDYPSIQLHFQLPHLLPTALPTLPPFKLPTIKLPTVSSIPIENPRLPHLLPTAFPTLFPPKPKDSPETNIICDICENAVTIVKTRIMSFEKVVRVKITGALGKVCDLLLSIPQLMILATPCNLFKANIIDKAFQKWDAFENSIQPETFCKHVPFCK
ncbi:CRE-SPP-11 protein [Caenorhabditis remanei]|uniref:CRE-SPP-11 protein n=1 Tax=Caenorhabditis remanei TaxID=31234 RepID=E3LR56_CAERE|nr:CRE-SPP-11 protein [Caenorhabditis remanei]